MAGDRSRAAREGRRARQRRRRRGQGHPPARRRMGGLKRGEGGVDRAAGGLHRTLAGRNRVLSLPHTLCGLGNRLRRQRRVMGVELVQMGERRPREKNGLLPGSRRMAEDGLRVILVRVGTEYGDVFVGARGRGEGGECPVLFFGVMCCVGLSCAGVVWVELGWAGLL